MCKTTATMLAPKRFLARMNTEMFFEVVLKLEGLLTLITFEAAQCIRIVVCQHVAVQSINICKTFGTQLTALERDTEEEEESTISNKTKHTK